MYACTIVSNLQVLYSMASELGQFLVVMSVVLLGFSLSFFALFKEAKDATFRDSLLDAFQAMLGEKSLPVPTYHASHGALSSAW